MSALPPAEEQDIRTLVELWPECLSVPMIYWREEGGISACYRSTPLQECISKGYSEELLDFMIDKFPENCGDFAIATPVCCNDLKWIGRVLQRCNGTFGCTGKLDWRGQRFHEFLGLLFLETNNVSGINLKIPSSLGGRDDGATQSMEKFKKMFALEPKTLPRLQRLYLGIPCAAYCGLLDCWPRWPCLRVLSLKAQNCLEASMTAICQLLELGQLQTLEINAIEADFVSRKRKGKNDDVDLPLKPLFESLANNTTLTCLVIQGMETKELRAANADLLVEALKQNTTLEGAVGFLAPLHCKKLTYYLTLNLCGRKVARNASTKLVDFVTCLESAKLKIEAKGPIFRHHFLASVQYGLLHEAVNKWV